MNVAITLIREDHRFLPEVHPTELLLHSIFHLERKHVEDQRFTTLPPYYHVENL